jgi:predicted nucleic acid-binding protein
MSDLVVDASVAIKWFLPEIHGGAALRLLEGEYALRAPDLIFLEFGNVLWKRFQKNQISPKEASATIEALLSVPLQVPIYSIADSASFGNRVWHASYSLRQSLPRRSNSPTIALCHG